jgi:hypothetical protein
MQFRYDTYNLKNWEQTPEGFIRFVCPISKEGDLIYRDSDGGTRVEFVGKDTLIQSADSFKMKPITLNHPPVAVTPDNAKEYQVGSLGHGVYFDNGLLWMTGIITDREAINAVKAGTARQVSAGYNARVVQRPDGKYEQVERIGNHVSLVRYGRAGSDVAIRLDGYDVAIREDSAELEAPVSFQISDTKSFQQLTRNDTMTYKFTLDGIEFETESIDLVKHAQSVQVKLDALNTEKSTLQTRADSLATEKSTLEGKVAGLETENAGLKQQAESRSDAAEIESEILIRMDAWGEVLPWLQREDENFQPDYKLSVADVRRTYLEKRTNQKLDGKDAAYIDGMYAALKPTEAESRADSGARVDSFLDEVGTARTQRADAYSGKGKNPVSERRKSRPLPGMAK